MGRAVQVELLMAGFTDESGEPLAAGKVYSYEAGTSTAKTLYTDQGKTTAATNPVILDSQGRALVFGEGAYKLIIKDANDVTLYTWDNLQYYYPDLATIYAGTSTGSSNAYVASPSPALTAYTDGLTVTFIANHATSGAATLNVSGLGAKSFVKADGSTALTTGDITSGMIVNAQYVSSSNHFRLINAPGVAAINAGGTGASTAADAADNLGVGASDNVTFGTITLTTSTATILTNTSDGSDNKQLLLGHLTASRGAYSQLGGNEHASIPGQAIISCGNVASGKVSLETPGSQLIELWTNGTQRLLLDTSGHFKPASNGVYDLGLTGSRFRNVYAGSFISSADSWTPTPTANNGGTIGSISHYTNKYARIGPWIEFEYSGSFDLTGAGVTALYIPAPVSGTMHNANASFICNIDEGLTTVANGGRWRYDGSDLFVFKPATATFTAGTIRVFIQGKYLV